MEVYPIEPSLFGAGRYSTCMTADLKQRDKVQEPINQNSCDRTDGRLWETSGEEDMLLLHMRKNFSDNYLYLPMEYQSRS